MRTLAKLTLSLFAAAAISGPAHAADISSHWGPSRARAISRAHRLSWSRPISSERSARAGTDRSGRIQAQRGIGWTHRGRCRRAQSDAGAPARAISGTATGKRQHKPPVTGRFIQGGNSACRGCLPRLRGRHHLRDRGTGEGSSRHLFTDDRQGLLADERQPDCHGRGAHWDPVTKRARLAWRRRRHPLRSAAAPILRRRYGRAGNARVGL